ncbi:hypothetical protein MTBPR1_40146 [Candidatus Terasakiella magnetica]|uniref:Methyltransferase FkbM domain-containing protein n=1 Tax=Candidatus Terasakiella magnetica TaxID=1867952 RepID=A0A1C3RIN4_9PROT|nr:FkbM family methyltransferase [Candidatus Terasakiella magnetica]SCA57123.1 hypothetical protein MTBPR1_40146 [Candidatus Terasakiella magnetica]
MTKVPFDFVINHQNKDHHLKFLFDTDQMSQNHILNCLNKNNVYEPELLFLFLRVLRSGDTFLDIGAHVGFFSVLAGHLVGAEGKGISVEPMAENHQAFEHNISLNGFDHVELVKGIISDENGESQIFFNADNDGGHSLWDPGTHEFNQKSRENPTQRPVHSRTLMSLLQSNRIRKVKLAKIDTEGAEVKILSASQNVLKIGQIDFIACELNPSALEAMGYHQKDLYDCVRACGYEVYIPKEDGSLPQLLPEGKYIQTQYAMNVVFTKPELIAQYW